MVFLASDIWEVNIFRIEELESQLECTYATKITELTKVRRLTDIRANVAVEQFFKC